MVMLTEPTLRRAGGGNYRLVGNMQAARFGVVWVVPDGFTTDGASIPPLCWPLVGHPYSPSSLRAAILHDWMCRNPAAHGLPSAAVHRVFFDALRADGVAWLRARAMWWAVRWCGPRFGAS